MHRLVALVSAVVLSACGSQAKPDAVADEAGTGKAQPVSLPAAAATPNLAACPARASVDEGLRQRNAPIAVPAALRAAMRSDMDNFALSTLDGATVCVDASWMESIRDPALSPDGRFASFGWDGYESYGHVIVDRSGTGQVVDTGVPPVASPSGKLLAAADLSESGFGALNAFAVWQIEPAGLRRLTSQEDLLEATDWRIEDWLGEACVNLTAVPWDSSGAANPPRERFRARASNGWRFEPGRCGDA